MAEQFSSSEVMAVLRGSRAVAFVAGVIAVAGGVALLVWPDRTVKAMAVVIGVVVVVLGLGQVLDALATRKAGTYWGWLLLRGLIDLAFGVVLVAWTGPTIWVLVVLVGLQLILSGLVGVIVSRLFPAGDPGRAFLLWRGVVGVLVGLAVLAWPEATLFVVVVLAAVYLLVAGVVLLYTGYRLGQIDRRISAA
jgi:uncharacterized membrane protein HdeD (DUF308 family)